MYKIFCDHCKEEVVLKKGNNINLLKYVISDIKNYDIEETVKDNLKYIKHAHICNDCISLLKKFLNINQQEDDHESSNMR